MPFGLITSCLCVGMVGGIIGAMLADMALDVIYGFMNDDEYED